MTTPAVCPPLNTRRGQVYVYICDELSHGRRSPSLPQIARQFEFSVARAQQLVARLVDEGFVTRTAGAQCSLNVPGVARNRAIELLRAEGYIVDEDAKTLGEGLLPFKLPMLGELRHIDLHDDGGEDEDDRDRRQHA